MTTAINGFRSAVDDVYGVFLDGTQGFGLVVRDYDRHRKQAMGMVPGTTAQDLDRSRFFYGVGAPGTPDAYPLHVCTQAEYRSRNDKDGKNHVVLANMCLVLVYQYWEDRYRKAIADELGIDKNELVLDIMGDLRILRNSIVHHDAVALGDVAKCRVLTGFAPGQPIKISKKKFEEIVFCVKSGLDGIVSRA